MSYFQYKGCSVTDQIRIKVSVVIFLRAISISKGCFLKKKILGILGINVPDILALKIFLLHIIQKCGVTHDWLLLSKNET